jgi:hypothetical protein
VVRLVVRAVFKVDKFGGFETAVLKSGGFHGLHASQFMEIACNLKTQPNLWRCVFCGMPAVFLCIIEDEGLTMSADPAALPAHGGVVRSGVVIRCSQVVDR